MNQYSTGTFTGQYKATIGADFITKDVVITDDRMGVSHIVTLQIWDTAGQERFQSLGQGFYRGADAAILTYDITDPLSLDHLNHWKSEFLEHVGSNMMMNTGYGISSAPQFPFVVIGNKYDKDKKGRKIPYHRAEEWCRSHGSITATTQQQHPSYNENQMYNTNNYYMNNNINDTGIPLPHYETSAKTGYNINEAFQEVAKLAFYYEEYRKRIQPQLFIPPHSAAAIDIRRQYSSYSDDNKNCC